MVRTRPRRRRGRPRPAAQSAPSKVTVERALPERAHPLHDQSVGEIAARLAGASGIFRRFGIDFRCQATCR